MKCWNFLQNLYKPLGFGDYKASRRELETKLAALELPFDSENRVHFKDVLMACSREALKQKLIDEGNDSIENAFSVPKEYEETNAKKK